MAQPSQRKSREIARVLLRMPVELHASLAKKAAAAGLSFNEFCVRRLASSSLEDWNPARTLVVRRAQAVFGDRLVGVIAIGSWSRGEAASDSDIDVLMVIDQSVPLTRELYRVWDEAPVELDGREVDPHFLHLPPAGEPAGPAWCEAAVDGRLWFDRDGDVSARLIATRRAIADGRLVRAFAHGQPYWKGAA